MRRVLRIYGFLAVCSALAFGVVAAVPSPAVAQNADQDALNELDQLKKVNDEIKEMQDLTAKGANRTQAESDRLKVLQDRKPEKKKKKLEEGLRQRQAAAKQGFAPLLPGTTKKIDEYFELQQAKKDLEAEEAKGAGADKKKVDRLKKRIAELEGTTPPTSSAGGGGGVKSAASLVIVEEECKPQCTIGR